MHLILQLMTLAINERDGHTIFFVQFRSWQLQMKLGGSPVLASI